MSFATNTNWQSYGGETTMSYLDPDARPDGAELRLGRHRHGGAGGADPRLRAAHDARTIGNFWVDLTRARSTSCCRCRSSWRWCWSRRAWCRPSRRSRRRRCVEPPTDADGTTGHRADDRRSARPPRRSPSSSSAPTAAASSTSTPPIRSRTRRRSPTSSRCWRSC